METGVLENRSYQRFFLETFLVEWKLLDALRVHLVIVLLETFLVEWKLQFHLRELPHAVSLKPS